MTKASSNNRKNIKSNPPSGVKKPDLSLKIPQFSVTIIVAVIIIRILLTMLPSHRVDMGMYNYWSHYLADQGLAGFYNSSHIVYAPFYMYFLMISGKIASLFSVSDLTHEFLIKMWAVLFEFIGAYLIYRIGKQLGKPRLGFWTAIFYVLNPAVFINSSVWGQFDSFFATILFGVVYCFCIQRKVMAAVLYMVAVLTKPQSIFLLPLVAYVFLCGNLQWKKVWPFSNKFYSKSALTSYFNKDYWLKFFYAALGVIGAYVLIVLPFFQPTPAASGNPLLMVVDLFLWVPRLYLKYVNDYPYATANGFNLWTILGGQVVNDGEPFLGLTYAAWEKIFLVWIWAFAVWLLIKSKQDDFKLYYIAYILAFGFFMVYGRMHERYLVPSLIFLAVCILWARWLWLPYILLSGCVLGNQWYMYELAKKDFYWLPKDDNLAMAIAIISLVILLYGIYYIVKVVKQNPKTGGGNLSPGAQAVRSK
jgi:Gpi18-like mannosyltransferase